MTETIEIPPEIDAKGEHECENSGYWYLEYKRNIRNSYLALTDKYLLSDFPITDDNRNIIIAYRQYLRNFININKEAIENGLNIEIDPIPNV